MLKNNPEIAKAYADYLLCRITQLVVFRVPQGSKGGERTVIVVWPQGLNVLPNDGGLNGQNFLTTRLFNAFLNGERAGVSKTMSKKQ